MPRMNNQINDKDKTPEDVGYVVTLEGRKPGMEGIEWITGGTQGNYVIWSKDFPFWNLVTRVVVLKVEGIC